MYDKPANVFVAGFIGSPAMNLLQVELDGDTLHFGGAEIRVPRQAADAVGVHPLGHRRRAARGHGRGRRGRRACATEVDVVEELGADAYVYGTTEFGGERRPIIARVDGRTPPAKGDVLHLAPRAGPPAHVRRRHRRAHRRI